MNSSGEAFEKWARENGIKGTSARLAWQAAIKYITSRPTTNTRMDAAEFKKDNPKTLVDRLRGIYPVPVPGQYKTEPILHVAAREIERLREEVYGLKQDNLSLYERDNHHMLDISRLEDMVAGKMKLVGFRCRSAGDGVDDWSFMPIRFLSQEHPDMVYELLYTNIDNKKPAEAG